MKPTTILTAALLCVLSPISFAKPLKVFILAGQSNMQGHADLSTFDYVGKDPLTAPILAAMRDAEGKPKVCEKVWISSLGCGGNQYSDMLVKTGKLTAGFGASDSKIGPEFTFGIYTEKMLKEPVLIIKTSWGGRSLHTDFRPPSAGQYKLPKEVQDVWDQHPQGAHGVPKLEDRKQWQEDKDAASGVMYRAMIEHVRKVLKDIKRVYPEYDEKAGYELAGFVWFQGFNDLVDGQTYPGGNYDEYSRLLSHFIRDVRKDLSAPKLPFVIGVLGVEGEKNVNFRKAMAAPADMPEFKGNVVAVDTAPFWDKDIEAAEPKQGEYNAIVATAHTLKIDGTLDKERKWDGYWKPVGTPLPEERIWRFATVDATEKKDIMEGAYTPRRFRDITLPAGMENWFMPEFDDSKWTSGKAPIGKGVWKHSGITLDKFPSTWGDGEFLLMRTTFEVEDLNFDSYRLAILGRQGYHVYLNGNKIHTYIWWTDKPQYGSLVLKEEQIKHLKKGKNVLAVYANDQFDAPESPHYAVMDVRIEGITKADQAKLDLALEEVFSPKDREALKGASNGGYHYFGSAKIFAQMGKAFAEALLHIVAAEPSSPPKDSPERKAILDALLPPLNKAEGAKVKFVDPTILVLNGWATVARPGFVREDGRAFRNVDGMFELDYFAVVQRVGTKWRIRSWLFSGDPHAVVEGRRANPEAPAQIFPEYADATLAREKAEREAEEPERNKVGIFSAKPGTPERKEIIETIRPRIEKELGEPVIFRVDFIHVGKEWALFRGRARKADDSQFPYDTKIDYVTVLLEKSETGWQIVDRSSIQIDLKSYDDLSDLQKKFPKAPALLFP